MKRKFKRKRNFKPVHVIILSVLMVLFWGCFIAFVVYKTMNYAE